MLRVDFRKVLTQAWYNKSGAGFTKKKRQVLTCMCCARINHDIGEPQTIYMLELDWKKRNFFNKTKGPFEQKAVALGRVEAGKYAQESNDWIFIRLEQIHK